MAAMEASDGRQGEPSPAHTMDLKLTPGRLHCAAVVALSMWFLRGFVHGLLVVGPVVLALAKELWHQRIRDLDVAPGSVSPARAIRTKPC